MECAIRSACPEVIQDAYRVANAPGAKRLQVNLPRDVLSGEAEFAPLSPPNAYRMPAVAAPSSEALAKAAELLTNAKQPVIVAGAALKMNALMR